MKSENKVQDKKPKQYTAEEFIKWYQDGCEERQFQIVVTPAWRATSHGSYELVQQTSVGRMPSERKNV